MVDEELRMSLVTIINAQSVIMKVISTFTPDKEREKLWEIAKALEKFSATIFSGEQNDTNA